MNKVVVIIVVITIIIIICLFSLLSGLNKYHHNISSLRVRKLIMKRNSGPARAVKADAFKAN